MIYLLIGNLISVWILIFLLLRRVRTKESEYYTDYVYKTLRMRVYRPEFEYQAIGQLLPSEILEMGNLSLYYKWVLIQPRLEASKKFRILKQK